MLDSKVYFAILLIILGIAGRTVFHLGDNIEFVTSATLLSGTHLGIFWAIFTPLTIMAITDLLIGNTIIFLFTWSAYVFIGILGFIFLHGVKGKIIKKTIKATFLGIIGSLIFYIWTNFGVWATDSYGMYPKTLIGLISAYIMGLPFLKFNLLGNLIFVPASFILFDLSLSLSKNYHKSIKRSKLLQRFLKHF